MYDNENANHGGRLNVPRYRRSKLKYLNAGSMILIVNRIRRHCNDNSQRSELISHLFQTSDKIDPIESHSFSYFIHYLIRFPKICIG